MSAVRAMWLGPESGVRLDTVEGDIQRHVMVYAPYTVEAFRRGLARLGARGVAPPYMECCPPLSDKVLRAFETAGGNR